MRKDLLVAGEIYHIFNKSIAEYKIFNTNEELLRMVYTVCYYQREKPPVSFSQFIRPTKTKEKDFSSIHSSDKEKLVEIICYCIMQTHIHLILKQLKDNGISIFMNNIQNSYSRYFNLKHNRKGPLWEGRFKNVLIRTDEQILHLTRYIHLNPVTAHLVNRPEEWFAISYREYLLEVEGNNRICKFDEILDIRPSSYKKFVDDRISYQKELAKIKDLLLE